MFHDHGVSVSVAEDVGALGAALPPGERQVAEVVLADPEVVAFGTVATVAERAGTSAPTVVRLAQRLGHAGYRGLQAAVRAELGDRLALRPAAERIRHVTATNALERAAATEAADVAATLGAVDPTAFAAAVRLLARRRGRVLVLAGDAERGIALTFADQLSQLRDGVEVVDGSAVRVRGRLAASPPGARDVAVAIDVRRYDAAVLDALEVLRSGGCPVVAVTDGALAPIAEGAAVTFVVTAAGTGPFDSHVGTLALLHALAAGVADRLRSTATERLDRIEAAWRSGGDLV